MTFLDDALQECLELVERETGNKLLAENVKHLWDILTLLDTLKSLPPQLYGSPTIGDYVKTEGVIICAENVKLRDYAYVRGPALLGKGVVLSAELKESILLSGTFAVHRNIYIGNTLLGRDCNVGAGTQFANLRFDQRPVRVKYGGTIYETGRTKLGAIVEHDCKFGVNSSIPPGEYVSRGSWWVGSTVLKSN